MLPISIPTLPHPLGDLYPSPVVVPHSFPKVVHVATQQSVCGVVAVVQLVVLGLLAALV